MRAVVFVAFVTVFACGCRHSAPSAQTSTATSTAVGGRSVFTDSLLHAEKCEPTKPGDDWRRICTPLNQSEPYSDKTNGQAGSCQTVKDRTSEAR